MILIQATIFFDQRYWVGTFERTDKKGYAVARHIFGKEPADQEVLDFVLTQYQTLQFGNPKELILKIKRMNPKRVEELLLKRGDSSSVKETAKCLGRQINR